MDIEEQIKDVCRAIEILLVHKNRTYGNSALEPLRVAATGSPLALIACRIDDKLSRMRNLGGLEAALKDTGNGEDTVMDLIGYLVLARVAVNSTWLPEEAQPLKK